MAIVIDKYFERLLALREITDKVAEKMLESAIIMGTSDFWSAYPWAFKETHDTITTTADEELVAMPDDFQGILSVLERETNDGRKLIRYSADEYDRLVPYSEDLTADTPAYYKIYYDGNEGGWMAALYPTPDSAITLYVKYHTIYSDGGIPDKYIGGYIAFIGKYLHMPGTPERTEAIVQANMELERMKQIDNPEAGTISRFLDVAEAHAARSKKWYED